MRGSSANVCRVAVIAAGLLGLAGCPDHGKKARNSQHGSGSATAIASGSAGLSAKTPSCRAEVPKACAAEAKSRSRGTKRDYRLVARAYATGCKGGDGAQCYRLAHLQRLGFGVTRSLALASQSATRGCKAGHKPSCALQARLAAPADKRTAAAAGKTAGELLAACKRDRPRACERVRALALTHLGKRGAKDQARALVLFRQLCKTGSLANCSRVGVMLAEGRSVEPDASAARELFERACRSDDPLGCARLGALLRDSKDHVERQRALVLLARSCARGNALACKKLGEVATKVSSANLDTAAFVRALTQGCSKRSIARATCAKLCLKKRAYQLCATYAASKAKTVLTKACGKGRGRACHELGRFYSRAKPVNKAQATRAYQRSCKLGFAASCGALASLLAAAPGKASAAEKQRVLALRSKACRLGALEVCGTLGLALRETDPAKAADLLRKGCRGDAAGGFCVALAPLLARGAGVPAHPAEAVAAARRACVVHARPDGCKWLAERDLPRWRRPGAPW